MQNINGNILFLGDENSPLLEWLKSIGESVIQTSEKLTVEYIHNNNIEFLVSYGYRHILKKDVLELFPNKAINLHISYLPWNKGADPNFWSLIKDTPKGVTIHYLDEGIDTGDIIIQKIVEFDYSKDTLSTSYEKLQKEIQNIFRQNWIEIKRGTCQRQKQVGDGSTQKVKDKESLLNILTDGWNTPIANLVEYSVEMQMSKQFWDKYNTEIDEIREKNNKETLSKNEPA
jgi:methionyl-tRNA formyltransferase